MRLLDKQALKPAAVVAVLLLGGIALWVTASNGKSGDKPADEVPPAKAQAAAAAASAGKPALSVNTTTATPAEWAQTLQANGNVAAWQEAVIGGEIGGFRLTEVLVNVGDRVKRGQVLARMSSDTVEADLAQTRASLAEAQAMMAEAVANAERARQLQTTGAISAQQINQYLTVEQTARARVQAQTARLKTEELRLSQTRVVAPDDGVISSRTATVGSMAQPGAELFRLIRGGRLEWRAEVTASELSRIKPGMTANLLQADGSRLQGKVRMVAPTIDPQTRNGIVYVDLPSAQAGNEARAGMFARGEFELGRSKAMTLPQSAVVLRDGFAYAFKVDADSRVSQTKITTGRRVGDRIEVIGGLKPDEAVVAAGAGFLADGDHVRVVQAAAPASVAQGKSATTTR